MHVIYAKNSALDQEVTVLMGNFQGIQRRICGLVTGPLLEQTMGPADNHITCLLSSESVFSNVGCTTSKSMT